MFAFLMRARHWRGWMRGSRTTSDLRSAETFSAHLTERRYGGMSRLRCGKMCRILWRSTISIPSTTDRSLRAITSGRRTATHRSFFADRLTIEMRTRPATTTDRMPRRAAEGSRQIAGRALGKGVQETKVSDLRLFFFLLFLRLFWCRSAGRAKQQLCSG